MVFNTARIKRMVSVASLAFALLGFSATPTPAGAAGIGDLLASLNVTEGCTQFTGPYGSPVTVQYYLPGGNCAAPAVIVLHGSDGGDRYQDAYEEVGRGLAVKGYAAFLVYYYQGAPGAPRPGPEDRALPDPRAFVPWVATVKGAISFVQNYPGVDPNRVGIMGMSLGGYVGSSVAANDPRVRSLVVLSGGIPDPVVPTLRTIAPTLIVHGDQDRDVSVHEAYKFHGYLAQRGLWHDLQILPCEGHLPYRTYKEAVAAKVLCFFDKAL